MQIRRNRQVISDDDSDGYPRRPPPGTSAEDWKLMRRKFLVNPYENDDDDHGEKTEEKEDAGATTSRSRPRRGLPDSGRDAEEVKRSHFEESKGDGGHGEDEREELLPEQKPNPVGEITAVSWEDGIDKLHYSAFVFTDTEYRLEDPVLITPLVIGKKPFVALIKEITQTLEKKMTVLCQWFYRPEDAIQRDGGHCESQDGRELFYSTDCYEVPAESLMHKCVIHYIPMDKKWPIKSEHPGFVVQNTYDSKERRIRSLTDKDYLGSKYDTEALIAKTRESIGELPGIIIMVDSCMKNTVQDLSAPDVTYFRSVIHSKAEMTEKYANKYKAILAKYKASTGDSYRDKCLEKLLKQMESACNSQEVQIIDDNVMQTGSTLRAKSNANDEAGVSHVPCDDFCTGGSLFLPDAGVVIVISLEKAAHASFGSDFQKYNQKIRQLLYNLKAGSQLTKRLLNNELDAATVVAMSPDELKDGLTAEERGSESEETRQLQMTNARCSICSKKKVGLADIIHAGGRGNRYQLECCNCGHTWYTSYNASLALPSDTSGETGKGSQS